MTRTARAAVYEAPNTPFIIKEYPLRRAKGGELLVRISMSSICRSDIHSWEGKRPNPCPGILGHEIIGVIEDIGDGVTNDLRGDRLNVGDRITWTEYFFDGPSYYADVHDMPQKSVGLRKYGHDSVEHDPHFLGGFAEYCYVMPGTGLLKLSDELSDEEATPLNCGVSTMVCVTEGEGESVVVQGLGLLGIYGVAMARARGAKVVIGIDAVPARLEMARRFGATLTIDAGHVSEDQLVQTVRDACPPDGADAVIEVCGIPKVISAGLQMLRTGGRYTTAGMTFPGANVTIDANHIVKRWITMRGIHNYHPRHLVQAHDFVLANRERFPFKDLVDSKFSLDEVNTAFQKAAERSVLRAAIVP